MELPQEELDRLDPARLEALAEPALREVAIRLLHALKEARAGQDARVIPLARCRALFDQFPLGIAVADGAGNIIETNPAADHLMGVTAAEHRRRPIDSPDWVIIDEKGQPLPPSDYPPVRALRRKITVKDEVIGRVDEQGGVTWLSVTAAPLAEDGRGVVITFEDVTERRAAEAIQRQLDAARERKGHLRNMAAALPVIAWWTKPDGTREFFNRHYSDFLGLDPGQVTGETQEWSPAIHPDDVDSYLQLIKTALRRRKSYDVELRVQRHDGEYRWINAMGRPWWGPDGDYFGVVGIAVDVTDRKQAELALRESNVRLREHAEKLAQLASQLTITEYRERQRFARLLHDRVQQDLIAVKFKLHALVHDTDPRVSGPVADAVALVDQSLLSSRALNTELTPPSLHDASFHGALTWLAQSFEHDYGLHVETELHGDLPVERADLRVVVFDAVREALLNVVKHAKVQTASLAMIPVEEDEILVRVSDAGPGLGPQGEPQPTATSQGLRTLEERIQLLGGGLEIGNRAGGGTELRLHVPLSPDVAKTSKR